MQIHNTSNSSSKSSDYISQYRDKCCTCFLPGPLQVRLAIAEKGLRCEEYDVSLPLSEHNEPWFMNLNPTGEVPVLVHDGSVICDPTHIVDYLEQNFSDGEAAERCQAVGRNPLLMQSFPLSPLTVAFFFLFSPAWI